MSRMNTARGRTRDDDGAPQERWPAGFGTTGRPPVNALVRDGHLSRSAARQSYPRLPAETRLAAIPIRQFYRDSLAGPARRLC